MKTYTRDLCLETRDCDMMGTWRPGAVLESLQETAGAHSEIIGVGRNALSRSGLAWVLSRLEVQMDRTPRMGEKVRLVTWPAPVRRWFFPRYFVGADEKGREFFRAASLWVLFDLNTRQMSRPDPILALMPDNRDLPAPLGLPGNVAELSEGLLTEDRFFAKYTDLDINQHVNNAHYIDWACNALGIACMRERELAHFEISYNAEIRPDQEIRTELRRMENAFSFSGYHGEKRCFDVGGTLRNREQ